MKVHENFNSQIQSQTLPKSQEDFASSLFFIPISQIEFFILVQELGH